jgi:replicative DNA helicase
VWTAFVQLQAEKMAIDNLTVTHQLDTMKVLKDVGGEAYLTELISRPQTSLHAEYYGRIVESMAIRRRMINAASAVAQLAFDTSKKIDDIVADSAEKMSTATAMSRRKRKSLLQLIAEHKVATKERSDRKEESIGILTKIPEVDKLLGFGLHNKFMILAGRPGMGKTSFAIQIALEAIKQGKTVLLFSLEMDEGQIMNVIMSMMAKVDSQRLALGRLSPDEWKAYNAASAEMLDLKDKLIIDASPGQTPQSIRARCLSVMGTRTLDLVVVDYLMRIRGYSKLDANDRATMITDDMFELKRELECSFILIHHMNRGIEYRGTGEPQLSDLMEGGERDPDIVAFLVPDKDVPKVGALIPMRIAFVKHRNGPTGSVPLLFKGECTTFLPAVQRYITLGGVK